MINKQYIQCGICKEWHWTSEPCAPAFEVFHEEYLGDDSKRIHAVSHSDAAEKYAAYYNTGADYEMMNGDPIKIKVVDASGKKKWFEVSAEPDIIYNSKEVKNG